jgi:hypothetical protein
MATIKLSRLLRDRIDEVFERCRDSKLVKKVADFTNTVKVFWPILNNSLSLVDLANIWVISVPIDSDEVIDSKIFIEFFNGIGRLKYPTTVGFEFCEKLLDDIGPAVNTFQGLNMLLFERAVDRSSINELFKMDQFLKKAFTSYAGESTIHVPGGLSWEEVKRLSLGMEVDGFLDLAEAYSISPSLLTLEQCTAVAQEIIDQYPVSSNDVMSPTATLLYPQFELMLCFIAIHTYEAKQVPSKSRPQSAVGISAFAKKSSGNETQPSKMINEFFKNTNIGKPTQFIGSARRQKSPDIDDTKNTDNQLSDDDDDVRPKMKSLSRCVDSYTSSLKHSRQGMLLRMHNLFEEVEDSLTSETLFANGEGPTPALMRYISNIRNGESLLSSSQRFARKPVVINDAIPLPDSCSPAVEQV